MCTKSDDRFLTRGLFRALLFRGGVAPRVIVTLLPSRASAEAKAHSRSRDDPAPDGPVVTVAAHMFLLVNTLVPDTPHAAYANVNRVQQAARLPNHVAMPSHG